MPKVCIVPNCYKKFKNDEKCSIFQVPQDEESRRKWEAAIPGIEVLKSTQHVCERHFEPKCIVRKLLKRAPNGKILIDIPYKRPRLLESVVPSIFECGSPAYEDPDKENSTIAVVRVAASKFDTHCSVPKTAPFRTVDNQQEAVTFAESVVVESEQLTAASRLSDQGTARNNEDMIASSEQAADNELKSLNEAENISSIADNPSVEMESHLTSDDRLLTFSVSDDSQINFQTVDDVCTVSLSKPWSVVESSRGHKRLILSQIVTNAACDVAVILKSVVIDDKKKMKYAVNGKLIMHDVPQLPQVLTDPRILPSILNEFHRLRICDGLTNTNVDLAEAAAICTDNMNINRSTKCMLIGKKKTCHYCVRLRKTLRQKNVRCEKRGHFKRFTVLSNPVDQSKLHFMRLKINRERRAKNRRTKRIELLSQSLRQKRDELIAVKDNLLEQQLETFSLPEAQKTALREIIAAAKKTDPRGRRYSNEWIMICMLMNIRSPAHYEFIRKNQIVPLPCIRTVRKYFSLIDSKCGFDEKFFELLKLKFQSKNPMQRHGLLVCDEISLRKSLTVSSKDLTYAGLTDFGDDGPRATNINDQATHGLVLLFQPLADKFTQPIAVFASKNPVKGEELAKLVVKAITLLERSGALIHGIVADGAHTNTKMGTSLGIDRTIENCKSWFTHPVDNERRVFVFSDAPHLIKNVRNRLHNKKKLRIIQTSLEWLDDWERAKMKGDVTSDEFLTPDTANGLRLSLHSTMGLCRYLIKKYNFEYLLSGKVNQDNLEKFFGTIRQAAGSNDHPSCSTFLQLYKLLSVYSMIKPPIYGNCTVDGDGKPPEILVTVDDLIDIYGRTESKISQITRNLQLKLDELVKHDDWKIDELGDHDYSLPQVLDCIIYYVTGLNA